LISRIDAAGDVAPAERQANRIPEETHMAGSLNLGIRNSLIGATLLAMVAGCSEQKRRANDAKNATADAASTMAQARKDSTYVGARYDPLPPGVSYEGGAVILGKNGKPSSFVLSHVVTPRGRYIWLDSIIPDGTRGGVLRSRVVRAELYLPAVGFGERLFIGSCDIKGKSDPSVVAVGENRQIDGKYTKIYRAWRGDTASGKFVVQLASDITSCEMTGAGG
jgi:hypothetical protein